MPAASSRSRSNAVADSSTAAASSPSRHRRTRSSDGLRAGSLTTSARFEACAHDSPLPDSRRWRDPDSNWGHHDFQSCALPTELSRRTGVDGSDSARAEATYAAPPAGPAGQLARGSPSGVRRASISARRGSSHGGRTTTRPARPRARRGRSPVRRRRSHRGCRRARESRSNGRNGGR